MIIIIVIALLAAGLVPLIQRDLRRAVIRRRFRRSFRAIGAFQAVLIPAMRKMVRAAADMQTAMARAQAASGMTREEFLKRFRETGQQP